MHAAKLTFSSREKLVIFDADGTLIDAFQAIALAFAQHGMDLGDLSRFQKRRKILKYLGGLRELPQNLRQQFGKQSRKHLRQTLTDIYRDEAQLYPCTTDLLRTLIDAAGIRVGIVTRNITRDPEETMRRLLRRHDIDLGRLDFFRSIPLSADKTTQFRDIRGLFSINPSRSHVCGDEYLDYAGAIGAGMNPLIAAYGFEGYTRLRDDFGIPEEVIVETPAELAWRLRHTLDVDCADPAVIL
jgi:phosphoglycolate phosphatase